MTLVRLLILLMLFLVLLTALFVALGQRIATANLHSSGPAFALAKQSAKQPTGSEASLGPFAVYGLTTGHHIDAEPDRFVTESDEHPAYSDIIEPDGRVAIDGAGKRQHQQSQAAASATNADGLS